jgi:hypothetical protein
MALAFDYPAAELRPLLPKVQLAVAAALFLASTTPDGPARVRVVIRGEQRRRLASPAQRRLAKTASAATTVDVSVATPSAAAAAATAAALTPASINTQLQALGVGPAAVVSAATAVDAAPTAAAGANATAAGGGLSNAGVVGLSVGAAVCGAAVSGLAYMLVQSRRRLARPHGKTVDLPSHCAASMEEGLAGQPSCPVTADMVRLGGEQVPTGVPA